MPDFDVIVDSLIHIEFFVAVLIIAWLGGLHDEHK